MYYGKRNLLLAWAAATAGGVLLHFLYGWLPNVGTALFSPVRESLWEHVKILYWPYLAAALLLNRGRPGGIRPWMLVLCGLCGAMLGLGYGYHILLGGDNAAVDIGLYLLLMTLGFWLPTLFSGPFHGVGWAVPLCLTVLLGILIAAFTLWPPEHVLFADLAAVRTWLHIPL